MPKDTRLYEALGVDPTADASTLKKAFRIMALKLHPDKNKDDPDANSKFIALRQGYDILADPKKRERYDRTGVVDADESDAFWNAYDAFRGVKVTAEDIDAYLRSYKGSKDEEEDVIDYFAAHAGDLSEILASIVGAVDSDSSRFKEIVERELVENSKMYDESVREVFRKTEILSEAALDAAGQNENDEDDEDDDDDEDEEEDDDGFIVRDKDRGVPVASDEDSSENEDDPRLDEVSRGDVILCRWNGGLTWYEARVTTAPRGKTFNVEYLRDGVVEKSVPRRYVRVVDFERTAGENKKAIAKRAPSTSSGAERKRARPSSSDDLASLIRKKNASRHQVAIDSLEAKYAGK